MRNFLLTLFVNSVSIAVASWLLPGIHVLGGTGDLVFVALVFGLVNAFLRPILTILSIPFIVVTLGIFYFILNGLLLMFVGSITTLEVNGLGWALLGSLVISIVNSILNGIIFDEEDQDKDRIIYQ
ncbi:MAG: phage holin family protein [Phototrophicaceae bacterium]